MFGKRRKLFEETIMMIFDEVATPVAQYVPFERHVLEDRIRRIRVPTIYCIGTCFRSER